MRPKTANHRNCKQFVYADFVEDKEKSEVPSPFDYNPITIKNDGKTSTSKLHSSILGWAGLKKKSPRFEDNPLGNSQLIQLTIQVLPVIHRTKSICRATHWADALAYHCAILL